MIFAAGTDKVTSHPALDYFPSPSQDGRYLAFISERAGNPDIWLKSLSAGAVSLPRHLTTHPAVDRDPALNADGSKLLYVSHKTDPRGDIYLMDLVTGEETQLTDLSSGDSIPQWGPEGNHFYYLKQNPSSGTEGIYRRDLESNEDQQIVERASGYSVGPNGWLVYSEEDALRMVNPAHPEDLTTLTSEGFLDLWPTLFVSGSDLLKRNHMVFFSRYEKDTNRDGILDRDDESSIWMSGWDESTHQSSGLYRMTPSGQFHLYPSAAQEFVYFSDVKKGDIFRIDINTFLNSYATFEEADILANDYLDKGQQVLGLLVLTNISRNLAIKFSFEKRAQFDLQYIERLIEAEQYGLAQQVLTSHSDSSGKIGALFQLHSIVLSIRQQAGEVSSAALKRLVKQNVSKLIAVGDEYRSDETVYGQALIEAGRLHLLTGDSLSALDYLTKVDELQDKEIRAKALFTRGMVYRQLGDEASLLNVFIDVIRIFGEDSSWGRRGVTQAIAVSEQGANVDEQVASLHALVNQHPDLPLLAASTRLRIADLYDEKGEQLKAIRELDRIVSNPPPFQELVERSYRRKAEILSTAERYQEAADAYAKLVELTGKDQVGLEQTRRLMVLQLVRKAMKDRSVGEVRIAAKALKQITEDYPESVEAHRGYIETKVMLKETNDAQERYTTLAKEHPDHAVYLYSQGLALSYAQTSDFPRIIGLIKQAIRLDPGISYFHQTLGWAYEQEERVSGKTGYLEKAEGEYRIALALNDEFQFPQVESNLLLNLGNTYLALTNFPEAYRHYRQRDGLHSPAGDSMTELLYRKNFGEACFKVGKSDESLTQYRMALKRVPTDNKALKAELLERIGLAQQDLGHYSEAVRSFSQAMEINLELGNQKNLALLQRNIGVNLYNLSTGENRTEREALKRALKNYFASLDVIQRSGAKDLKKRKGLLNLEIAIDKEGSQAATGFDRVGEKKLMFSYIAGTYEKLSQPAPAREFYLKKLNLLSDSTDTETDVARLAEKAVVLNRLGMLSHQLGLHDEALDYMRQSMGYAQTLELEYGVGVNLYNISRLAVERSLADHAVDGSIVDTLVTGLDQQITDNRKDVQTFYTLTNTAFLLYNLPIDRLNGSLKVNDILRRMYDIYGYKQRVWPYYSKAKEIAQNEQVFSKEQAIPLLVVLNLNLLELAFESGKEGAAQQLRADLLELVEDKSSSNSWLWYVSQAEQAADPMDRLELLGKAFDLLIKFPSQAYPKGTTQSWSSSYDRLSELYVDVLVKNKDYTRAFSVAERIAIRKISSTLYNNVGLEFFLKGLGDYEGDLREILSEIQKEISKENSERLDELSIELEEILFALYEEYPEKVSAFWQYAPTNDILSGVVNLERPYLKIVPGRKGLHGFLHDGTEVKYAPVEVRGGIVRFSEPFSYMLSDCISLYLSLPEKFDMSILLPSLSGKPIARVTSFYDFMNGYHQRSLFYTKVAVAGELTLTPNLSAGEVPISTQSITETLEDHQAALAEIDILVSTRGHKGLRLEVGEEMGVQDFISVEDLADGAHHTALVLDHRSTGMENTALLVSGLIHSGFPHVVVSTKSYDQTQAQRFASLYLAYLADLPPVEAVAMVGQEMFGENLSSSPFIFYGYGGMEEEEKVEFASSMYSQELDEAVALYQEGKFSEALHKMENALSVIDYANKREDFNELTKLTVDAAFQVGEYEKAVFHQKNLLNALSNSPDLEEKSEVLYQLGILYSRLEQFEPAIQHLKEAIDLWTQAEELDRLAEGIATLGVVRENMGDYSEALVEFDRSYNLYQEIGEIGDVATQNRRIGRIYYLRLGLYEKARKQFLAALAHYQELEDRRGEAETLFEIGLTYEKMGLFDEADQRYQKGIRIGEELDDSFLLASGHLYMANTDWFRGDYQEAFQSLTRARKFAEKADDTQLRIMVRNTRGLIYWTLNDTDKGLNHLKQAIALAEEADIKTELASSLNNMGLIYRQRGEYVTSLEYFEKAKGIDESLNSRWGLGYDYRNIGMSLLKLDRLTEAEANFVRAEQTSAEIKNAINWVKALLELGNVNRDLKKPDNALGYYEEAYTRAQKYGIKEVQWRAAAGKANLLKDRGSQEEAFTWYANAVEIVEGMRASLKIDELRNTFQANKLDLYRDTISLLVNMGRTEDAFNYLERSRSRSFIDLLGNQKLTLKSEVDQQALEKISALSVRVDALKTELGSYDEPPTDLLEQYREAKVFYDEAIIDLKQNSPSLSSFIAVDPLTESDVEELLEAGVGLLSYMLAKDEVYIWLLKQKGTSFYRNPIGSQDIATIVRSYRDAVQHLEPVDDELTKLYDFLIKPVEQDLEDLAYVGIIPDGPLHFLSFSALKKKQTYLVERFALFYTPSASVLKFTFSKRGEKKVTNVLAVGNPDLGNFNYDLPLAELEAQSIKWNYPDMDILTGSRATKEWFIKNISRYGVIHLAAHGEFDEFNPLFSSLWLASDQPDNRRLTVKEVFGLEINADLVTLSACQTGLGKLEAGEIIGLNRAFIYAGTHALVSALWRVDDLSTSVMMKHFYRNYVTMDKAKSLRQAQLIVKKEFPHPSYWAGFNLVGDYQ